MKRKSGFTLLETIVVLGIIAILAAIITPLTVQTVGARRERAAREELDVLKEAIVGKAKSTEHGAEFTFGFVGDIGNVPDSLDRLKTIGSLPAYSFDTTKDMGAGWRGPYIMEKHGGDFKKDPWGTDYSYSTTPGTNTDLGVQYLAKITSKGPDRTAGTSDDLSVEVLKPEILSDAIGMVKYANGSPVPSVSVTMNYPSNGSLTTSTTTTNSSGVYQFSDIPIGDRTVTVAPKLLYVPGTAVTTSAPGDDIKFTIANYSSSNISITSLNPVYSGGTDYLKIHINDVEVYSSPRVGSGVTVSFPSRTLTGSTGAINPFPIRMQSSKVKPPDIVVDRIERGGTLEFKLTQFKTPGGAAANMTGVSFSITFSDGSVVSFTVGGG